MKSPYLMVSLEDSESKAVAQVLSNDTSRQIMKYMTGHDKVSETEIAKTLDLPLSTVHYNMQHLLKTKLVEALEFHYSEKGKEVLHYSLSNKIIVIAPKKDDKKLLKKALPVIGFIGLFTVGLSILRENVFSQSSMRLMAGTAEATIMKSTSEQIAAVPSVFSSSIVFWFVAGALITLGFYMLFDYLSNKK